MKKTILSLIILALLLVECKQNPPKNDLKENVVNIRVFTNYETNNPALISFVKDYISIPENKHLSVFTMLFDQRMDTLLYTISTCPFRFPEKVFYFGAMEYNSKIILMCSPFNDIGAKVDSNFIKKIKQLNDKDMMFFSKKEAYTRMSWQLQKLYNSKTFYIEKDQYKIWNTICPPPPPTTDNLTK